MRAAVLAGILGVLILANVPVIHAATPQYLTTNVTDSGLRLATIDGYSGALANLTNTTPASLQAFIYMDLTNHAGQTVYWNFGACTLDSAQMVQCFVPFVTSLTGNYTVTVFATTDTNVPISTSSSYQVSL